MGDGHAIPTYFSHSYRDVPINTYFSGLFNQAGITLQADQKTDVWCMAKLERYLFEMPGFVSIIPRRLTADGAVGFSPYILQELKLARRARAPRVLFVDSQVLDCWRHAFPKTAIPFHHDKPETELKHHKEVIEQFKRDLTSGQGRPARQYTARQVTVVTGNDPALRDAASYVAAILRTEGYKPAVKNTAGLDEAFDDIDGFESLLDSELCVFVLGNELSYSDVFLAMAHAHCVPSMRLRRDHEAKSADPEISGVVRWKSSEELAAQFLKVFRNYQSAFESPASAADLRRIATVSGQGEEWDPSDANALLAFIRPADGYVGDLVNGVMRLHGALLDRSRLQSDTVCRALYDRIKRQRSYYTYEPVSEKAHRQRIRAPRQIDQANEGTCLDLVCFFASLLEAAHERPLVIIVDGAEWSHALAGYFAPDAIPWNAPPNLEDLRRAVKSGEVVIFEATGAVEARQGIVAAETEDERREGNLLLDYRTAKDAAQRLLLRPDIALRYCLDVRQVRLRAAQT